MAYIYSDPTRESDAYALPDVEVFESFNCDEEILQWYYWACFPGCLPDGDPVGPFETEADATADAQDS